jgi:hypothetical protein
MDNWFFIHVMKTAGTSFRRMLEAALRDRIFPTEQDLSQRENRWYLSTPELIELISSGRLDLDRIRVVCGHYPARIAEHLPGKWRTAIFLRDPIDRTLSMIAHRKRQGGLFSRQGKINFERFLKQEEFVANQIADYQTKVLAMDGTGNVNRAYRIDEEAFRRAKDVLMQMDFIGTTEDFSDSIQTFHQISGINLDNKILHANKSKEYTASASVIEMIQDLVAYDLQIYEIARTKLLPQVGQAVK